MEPWGTPVCNGIMLEETPSISTIGYGQWDNLWTIVMQCREFHNEPFFLLKCRDLKYRRNKERRSKENDINTRLFRKVSYVLFDTGLIWVANFGPIFAKKSLNLLHISSLSLITLESTMISSNVFRFVLDLHMLLDRVCHVFLISFLYWENKWMNK